MTCEISSSALEAMREGRKLLDQAISDRTLVGRKLRRFFQGPSNPLAGPVRKLPYWLRSAGGGLWVVVNRDHHPIGHCGDYWTSRDADYGDYPDAFVVPTEDQYRRLLDEVPRLGRQSDDFVTYQDHTGPWHSRMWLRGYIRAFEAVEALFREPRGVLTRLTEPELLDLLLAGGFARGYGAEKAIAACLKRLEDAENIVGGATTTGRGVR